MRIFFILCILFISCKQESSTAPKNNTTKTVQPKHIDTTQQTVSKEQKSIPKKADLSSYLKTKVERLSALKSNYIIKKSGVIEGENAGLLGRIAMLYKYFPEEMETIHIDVDTLRSQIHEARFTFVKGTKSVSPGGNTYPRATVNEYIFNHEEDATKAFKKFKKLSASSRLWTHISKAPSALFQEENRIYFMTTGGHYMMDMYQEIENELKKLQ